ncbi:OLC1v1013529C1 [Oldenlandia corymbosa var. corymbosa]|uniref:OLC1v1013529C1 n=1 Tax=Oldenlandia corymbosa var. corymbosa TaxID=529605 RepID=A0AAV1E200_OLDCO|nr:OLC1v1013529C1 [Oldenlandia corymbosa var. corymbosa]
MVPDSSLLVASGTRDVHGRVISASARRGSPSEHKSQGQSHMGQAGSSVRLDDVFDHASCDQQDVSDNDDIPTEDIDSEGFNDFGSDSPPHLPRHSPPHSLPHSPPARRSNVIRLRVRGLGAASVSASSSAASNTQPWVVTGPVVGGPHDGSVIPSFLGHMAHRLAKSCKPSLEMDTTIIYFNLLKEWKGSMSTKAQILLAGKLIITQSGTVDCETLVMTVLRMTSQTLQTSKVIHGGGVQSGFVAKKG